MYVFPKIEPGDDELSSKSFFIKQDVVFFILICSEFTLIVDIITEKNNKKTTVPTIIFLFI